MTINNFNDIIDKSVAFLKDDYTELWIIVNAINEFNPQLSFSEIIQATQDVISYLSEEYNLKLVDVDTRLPSTKSKHEILEIVQNLMITLTRLPNIGDGVWLSI